ncbi:MAG: universal stress protein [Rhizobiaceae bacterium]
MAAELASRSARRILLATDLSARCDRALDRAAMLVAESSAHLTVVHAFEADVYALTRDPRPAPSWRQQPNLKQAIAVKQLHQDLGQLDVPFDVVLEEGEPAEVILRSANQSGDQLIVTGIARGETFGRYIFGGTVDRLVRNATLPVLVVKNRARTPYRDIVVATDFSQASRRAIDETTRMFPEARITLLHCYESTPSSMTRPISGAEGGRQFAEGEYRDFINGDPASAARLAGLPIYMEKGSIDCVIHAHAADKSLDLVVIGSQGKNVVTRVLIGSTAEMAMASAPTDVLVIPPAVRAA